MANNNNTATFFAISTILLLLVSSLSLLPSVTTMAQQIPLTQEELDQQNRLQNEITATTKNLAQGQKEVNGVAYTPRWSNPVRVEANSLSILFAYCLPGEFADSGQEILGGSQLEVLESYSLAVTSNVTGWLMVVENEDTQNRLPAAAGVICASDANDAQSRILSPGEQQEINNIIQQFITIQNTQVTNIENVINIINNVTNTNPPPQNETGGGGGMTPQPPANDTGPTEEQLPKVKANVYPTVAFVTPDRPAEIVFDADATGGTPPYEYFWSGTYFGGGFVEDKSFRLQFTEPVVHDFRITVYDSKGYYAYEDVRVRVLRGEEESAAAQPTNDTGAASATATEPPLRVEAIANSTQATAPATIKLDANITGGAPPYSYSWSVPNVGLIDYDRSITQMFFEPGTFTYTLTVTDSRGKTVTDNVQIVISERLPTEGIVAPEPGGVAPPIEGLSPRVPGGEGEEQGGGGVTEEPEGVPPPPPTGPGEEGGEGDTGEGEEGGGGEPQGGGVIEEPTGGGGEEPPPDEEPTIPPG
jgi:hypothetical protein